MSNPAIMLYVPFALNGVKSLINVTRATGQADQDATWNDGFPSITMIPESSGGKAPNGQDFNGIFYALSLDVINRQKGQRPMFDATYATNIGGYAKGSIVLSTSLNKEYISTVDNNLTNPDSSLSSGWSIYSGTGSVPLATSTIAGVAKLVNNLTSNATDAALTANQGRLLQDSKLNKTDIIAPGNPPLFACRAWVNFDGTTGAIRASGNISSVVRTGTGNYTINFTTAMPDKFYSISGSGSAVTTMTDFPQNSAVLLPYEYGTTYCKVGTIRNSDDISGQNRDFLFTHIVFFR